jgi:thioester reductase-like protein
MSDNSISRPDMEKLRDNSNMIRLVVIIYSPESANTYYLQVTGKEIFKVLKEKHGNKFELFIENKLHPLAGDIMYENFGLHDVQLKELTDDVDIIVNGAATTNFYERFRWFLNPRLLSYIYAVNFF